MKRRLARPSATRRSSRPRTRGVVHAQRGGATEKVSETQAECPFILTARGTMASGRAGGAGHDAHPPCQRGGERRGHLADETAHNFLLTPTGTIKSSQDPADAANRDARQHRAGRAEFAVAISARRCSATSAPCGHARDVALKAESVFPTKRREGRSCCITAKRAEALAASTSSSLPIEEPTATRSRRRQ